MAHARGLYFGIGRAPFGFIEDDKLDTCDIRQQTSLNLADNPGDSDAGPVVLQVTHNRKRMAGIADRRETNDADVCRWRVQVRQVDTKGRIR